MMRIVVLGQPGAFGAKWCRHAADRLAQRLSLPCLAASDPAAAAPDDDGWVVTATVGELPARLLQSADTAIWLHFLPLAVARMWAKGLHARLAGSIHATHLPRLADVRDSLLHMAWTPHVHRLLRHPALAHLQTFHLRSPDETDFWLRAQEHRLPPRHSTVPQAA